MRGIIVGSTATAVSAATGVARSCCPFYCSVCADAALAKTIFYNRSKGPSVVREVPRQVE